MLSQNRDNNSLVIGLEAVRRYRELEFRKIQQSKVNNEISQNNLELNRERFLKFLQGDNLKSEIDHTRDIDISNKSLSLIWPSVYEMKCMDSAADGQSNCEVLKSDIRRNLMNDIRMRFMNLEQNEIDKSIDSDLVFNKYLESYREIWKELSENNNNNPKKHSNSGRNALHETTKVEANIRWSISTLGSQEKKTIIKQQNEIAQMINEKLCEYRELEENAKEVTIRGEGEEFEEIEIDKIGDETKAKEIPANLIDKKKMKKEVKIEEDKEKPVVEVTIESGKLPDYILPGNSNKSLDYQTKQWIRRHPIIRK